VKIISFKIPLLTIVIGAAIVASSYLIMNWYNWNPANFPLNMRSVLSQSTKFKVNFTANYEINVDVERNLPFEQTNCLLGIETIYPDRCKNTNPVIKMKWHVLSGGAQIAEGNSDEVNSGGWGQTISRTIGRFQGEKGKEYLVIIESLHDLSILAPTNPKIKVEVHPMAYEGNFIIASLVGWSGLAVCVVGVMYLFVVFYRQKNLTRG
jgi:hypothetical protein